MDIVKAELLQFIATLIENSTLEKEAARHDIVASLLQEVLKIAQEDQGYNHFILKPLHKAEVIVLKERVDALKNTPNINSNTIKHQLNKYQEAISTLEALITAFNKSREV